MNNLHDTSCCFNIVFRLLLNTDLSDVNINIGILIFLNMKPPQNLVFANSNKYGITPELVGPLDPLIYIFLVQNVELSQT